MGLPFNTLLALKVALQNRLIITSVRTLNFMGVNKMAGRPHIRFTYVYARPSIHHLYFVYARKIYVRAHVKIKNPH